MVLVELVPSWTLSSIPKNRERDVSETGSVAVLR
jgi:hypothetical protein